MKIFGKYGKMKQTKRQRKYNDVKNIITFGADGEHQIKDIDKVIEFQKKNNSDLIICNRKKLNRFSEKIVSTLFNYKFKIYDPLSGFKLYKAERLKLVLNF